MMASDTSNPAGEDGGPPRVPEIQQITTDTVKAALHKGFQDFKAAPSFGLFFGAVYVVGGWMLWFFATSVGNAGLLVPLAFIFPLLGPFAAVGLYEVSRRIETGEALDWSSVLGAVFRTRNGQLPFMGVVILFLALVWLVLTRITFALFLGDDAITNIFSTREAIFTFDGFLMMILNTIVGFAVAFLVFAITVVGMPMLLQHDIDFVTAMITSFQAVLENLRPMLIWAGTVVVLLFIGMLPAFLGLLIVLPVLGHGTWHLYRAVMK